MSSSVRCPQPLTVKEENSMMQSWSQVYSFYRNGFRSMTVGKTLWKIILIKLLVMFAVLKLFFFPNYLNSQFQTDEQRAEHVLGQISRSNSAQDH